MPSSPGSSPRRSTTQTFGRERTRSVEEWETYLERTPVEDMEREKLLLLLNRNEWNIARVSRLMGVTRRTIYLRLAALQHPPGKGSQEPADEVGYGLTVAGAASAPAVLPQTRDK